MAGKKSGRKRTQNRVSARVTRLETRVGQHDLLLSHVIGAQRDFAAAHLEMAVAQRNLAASQRQMAASQQNLIAAQQQTNRYLIAIGDTLKKSAQTFEHMDARLNSNDQSLKALERGQKLVVDRLDRLVKASTRDRTQWARRFDHLDRRLENLEKPLPPER